jgi:hypothetical protein
MVPNVKKQMPMGSRIVIWGAVIPASATRFSVPNPAYF